MSSLIDGARPIRRGKVWLVGAGPGDPELLTLRAYRLLTNARVIAYDELVAPEILALAPADAERIAVGRRASGCRHHEARIHPLIAQRAVEGHDVVRLKGGDPFVFGRGGEEAEELAAARVPFEVVPGISAALGAAAAAAIPLTHRESAASVTFVTAHAAQGQPDVAANVPAAGTLVFFMGLGLLVPLAIEVYELAPSLLKGHAFHGDRNLALTASGLVLFGGFLLRYIFVYAGQLSSFHRMGMLQ